MSNRFSVVFKTLSYVFLLLFLVFTFLVGEKLYGTYHTKTVDNQLRETYTMVQEGTEEDSDWSHGLLDKNPDYAGWLTVYGTGIHNPVVLKDNDYYLRRDFYGEYSVAGTLFFDQTTDFSKDGNLIIYGHKMRDSTMFGDLEKYKDQEFFEENNIILLNTVNGEAYYKVIAGLVVPGSVESPDYIDISQWSNVITADEWSDMMTEIQNRAFLFQQGRYSSTDKYLFLVTCDYTKDNGRLVIMAKKAE